MKSFVVCVLFLVSVCFADRTIFDGISADGQVAWVGSSKFSLASNDNDVFACVMGTRYPWDSSSNVPPFASITYTAGNVSVSDASALWSLSLTGVVMLFSDITEYCELNGVDGLQLIGDAPLKVLSYTQAVWNPIRGGRTQEGTRWANLSETQGVFQLNCRAGLDDYVEGIPVGPYAVKCGIVVDVHNMWSTDAIAQMCPDNKRFFSLDLYFAAADIDQTGSYDLNGGSDQFGQNKISFDTDGTEFRWKTTVSNIFDGSLHDVVAEFGNWTVPYSNLPAQIKESTTCRFSIMSSKADASANAAFYWDPVFAVDEKLGAASATVPLLVLFALLALMLLA